MLKILHTNDFHGAWGPKSLEKLHSLREQVDLYFDCGDGIKTGNLGIPLKPEAYWRHLKMLRCTASTLGNRETHPLLSAFEAKLAGASQPILVANLEGSKLPVLIQRSLSLTVNDIRIGVVGGMVSMATDRMKTASAWSCRWKSAEESLEQEGARLRPNVDLLIALTHIGARRDVEFAHTTRVFDVVLGSHSHTILSEPKVEGRALVAQAGSHGRFAGIVEISGGNAAGHLVSLSAE